MAEGKVKKFRAAVWRHYRRNGRHRLPWRQTRDPYKILVSEIMLQQTQVERVTPFYKNFLQRFPTVQALARSPLSSALRQWQGLGYNRRAKHLREAAKEIVTRHRGIFPTSVEDLEALPGIGPYTARAVAAFAYGQDVVVVETNIRTAVIHHFFPGKKKINDRDIEKVLARALPKGRAREWYGALMDYGAYLKRSGVSHNARSVAYARQSKFSGSLREARGAILRALARASATRGELGGLVGAGREERFSAALSALLAEGLVARRQERYRLPR